MVGIKQKVVFEYEQNGQIPIHPAHAQSFMRVFALHRYILLCPTTLLVDIKGPDQTAWMHRLIWAFAVRICPKTHFCMALPISTMHEQIVKIQVNLPLVSSTVIFAIIH